MPKMIKAKKQTTNDSMQKNNAIYKIGFSFANKPQTKDIIPTKPTIENIETRFLSFIKKPQSRIESYLREVR